MDKLISKITEKQAELAIEMEKFHAKNNKAAGLRARKLTLELTKLYKEFRGLSTGREK